MHIPCVIRLVYESNFLWAEKQHEYVETKQINKLAVFLVKIVSVVFA